MKIIIYKNGMPSYIYHHPRDVLYDMKNMSIRIGHTDPMSFYLTKEPKVQLVRIPASDLAEILVEFEIKDSESK